MSALFTYTRRIARMMTMYTFAFGVQLAIGLATTIFIVHHLEPAAYGKLTLYQLVPSTLLVVSTMGLIQGTNALVYQHKGETVADAAGREDYFVRWVTGTGFLLSMMTSTATAAVAIIFAPQISSALGGVPGGSTYVVIGAVSGALAAGWRMVSNLQRYAGRPLRWTIAHTSRVVVSLVAIVVLLDLGSGVGGVILGFAIGTLGGFVISLVLGRGEIRFRFDRSVAGPILRKAGEWAPIVLMFYVTLSLGAYFMKLTGSSYFQVGVYSLALTLAIPAHYAVSAFVYSWGPLMHSPLRIAVVREEGQTGTDSAMVELFTLLACLIVVTLGLFASLLVQIAPHSYTEAAKLAPIVALLPIGRGYFMLTLALGPRHGRYTLRLLALGCLLAFVPSAILLGPILHAYGVALAGPIAFGLVSGVQFVLMQRSERPLKLRPQRMLAPPVLAAAVVVPAVLLLPRVDDLAQVLLKVTLLLAYVGALTLLGAIPLRAIIRQLREGRGASAPSRDALRRALRTLTPADGELLRDLIHGHRPFDALARERGETPPAVQTRLVAIVGHLAGLRPPQQLHWRAGECLTFRGPYAERDRLVHEVVDAGSDPLALDRAQQIVARLRRLPARAWVPGDGTATIPMDCVIDSSGNGSPSPVESTRPSDAGAADDPMFVDS